jgi:hypothetical protein
LLATEPQSIFGSFSMADPIHAGYDISEIITASQARKLCPKLRRFIVQSSLRFALLVGTLACLGGSATITRADQNSEKRSDSSPVDAATAKKKVLAWIDDYRKVQVLFHDEDVARLRKDLAEDTPAEALQWWTKTASVRAALDSPEWQKTREWLREFLRVQAIYSDEQIEEFRAELKQAAENNKPGDFQDMLADIERRRSRLIGGSADSKALREHQLSVIEAFRKEQAAERVAAAKAAASATPVNPVQAAPLAPRKPRVPTAPLVNSLDVARWSVMRNFWRW